MDVLNGQIKYHNSRNIEGVNIHVDIFSGYIENKETFEAREEAQVPTLGTVFASTIGNVKVINDAVLEICKSLARTNNTIFETKVMISVYYDNTIKLGKNYIIIIYLPDNGGLIYLHCNHKFMDMQNQESRENDIYDLTIKFFSDISQITDEVIKSGLSQQTTTTDTQSEDQGEGETVSSTSSISNEDKTVTQIVTIEYVNDDVEFVKTKTYDSSMVEFITNLEKSVPNPIPKDSFIIENLYTKK